MARRVLVETRFCGTSLDRAWYPDFEAIVLEETDSRVAVKRHWWTRREWLPKRGPFTRVSEIAEAS